MITVITKRVQMASVPFHLGKNGAGAEISIKIDSSTTYKGTPVRYVLGIDACFIHKRGQFRRLLDNSECFTVLYLNVTRKSKYHLTLLNKTSGFHETNTGRGACRHPPTTTADWESRGPIDVFRFSLHP